MDTLGRYELRGVLGDGGFGAVYHAWDPLLGRVVALKVLHAHLTADADMRRRFLTEARALAPLQHPNIVTVYDVSEADGRPFFTMELISGNTLADLLAAHGPLPLADVIAALGSLAGAMDHIHAAGLVHRDIKASNVMQEPSGRVVLMDFGIARVLNATSHTNPSAILGTPTAMAPEQIKGQAAGPPADIYALGILAYQLLANVLPFSGDLAYLLFAHVYETPPPLNLLRPDLPGHVCDAIHAALAKDPAWRPASARALMEALIGAVDAPAPVPPPQVLETGTVEAGVARLPPTLPFLPPTLELPQDAGDAPPLTDATSGTTAAARRVRRPRAILAALATPAIGIAAVSAILLARGTPGTPKLPGPDGAAAATASVAPTTDARIPMIANFTVYDDVVSGRTGSFEERESVAACFDVGAGTDREQLSVVVAVGTEPPVGADAPSIVAHSTTPEQPGAAACVPVRAVSGLLAAGEYTAWVLRGSDVLARASFRIVAPPPPSPTEASTPTPATSTTTPTPTRIPTPATAVQPPILRTPTAAPTVAPTEIPIPTAAATAMPAPTPEPARPPATATPTPTPTIAATLLPTSVATPSPSPTRPPPPLPPGG